MGIGFTGAKNTSSKRNISHMNSIFVKGSVQDKDNGTEKQRFGGISYYNKNDTSLATKKFHVTPDSSKSMNPSGSSGNSSMKSMVDAAKLVVQARLKMAAAAKSKSVAQMTIEKSKTDNKVSNITTNRRYTYYYIYMMLK